MLVVIWAICLAIFLRFMEPPAMSDQIGYFLDADDPSSIGIGVRDFRIGLLLPLNVLMRLFGYSELSYYFFPFLAFAGTTSVIFGLGRAYFSTFTGLFAAFLFAVTPAVLGDVSHLLPDYFTATLVGAAVLVLIHATRGMSAGTRSTNRLTALFALAGMLLGLSYLVREFAVLVYPMIGLAMLLLRVRFRYFAALGAGALFFLGLEFIWGALHYGDPFTRLRYVVFTRQEVVAAMDFADVPYETEFWPALWQFFDRGSVNFPILSWLFILGLLSFVWLAIRATRRYAYLVAWGLTSWILLSVIAVIPTLGGDLILRLHKFRYWVLGLPPLYVVIAASVWLGPQALMRLLVDRRMPARITTPPAEVG